jgi:hypothetical protein
MDKFSVRNTARLPPLPAGPVKLEKDLLVKNAVGKQPLIIAKPAGNIHVPGAQTEVAARAGRFLFMALALPPYLVLYTLPKWVMTAVVPFLLHKGLEGLQYTLQHLNKAYEMVLSALTNAFRTTQGWISWSLKKVSEDTVSLFNGLGQRMNRHHHALKSKLKRMVSTIAAPISWTKSWLKALIDSVINKIKNLLKLVLEPIYRISHHIRHDYLQPLHRWVSLAFSQISNRLNTYLQLLQNGIKLLLKPLSGALRPIKQLPALFNPLKPLFARMTVRLSLPRISLPKIQIRKPSLPSLHIKERLLQLNKKIIQHAWAFNDFLENSWKNRNRIMKMLLKGLFRAIPLIPILFIIIRWLALKLFLVFKRIAEKVIAFATPFITPLIRTYRLIPSFLSAVVATSTAFLASASRPISYTAAFLTRLLSGLTLNIVQIITWCGIVLDLWIDHLHSTVLDIESKFFSKK